MMPADGIAAAPETSARLAGGFQKNYTNLLCARKGGRLVGGRSFGPLLPRVCVTTCPQLAKADAAPAAHPLVTVLHTLEQQLDLEEMTARRHLEER
jgi:hypothetical protein